MSAATGPALRREDEGTLGILLVTHQFPPRSRAGVEVHTLGLAKALEKRGHRVRVLTTTDDPALGVGAERRVEVEGVAVLEVGHDRVARVPEDTLGRPEVSAAFERALEVFGPDVVHFQHLMYVGLDAVRAARRHGARVVLTLHEYWLLCPRGGQMRMADGSLCATPEVGRCARCLADHRFGRTPFEGRVARLGARVGALVGRDPFPLLKRIALTLRSGRGGNAVSAREVDPAPLESFLTARERRVRELRESVHVVLAPSRFLIGRFEASGWPRGRIRHWPNGVPVGEVAGSRGEPPDGTLRVLFLGSFVPQKGLHVLLSAMARLAGRPVRLIAHGSRRGDPAYAREMARKARGLPVALAPPFHDVAGTRRAFENADLLVVPSLWYENAPLVISEARAAGVPVLASALGGMAEMVEEGGGRTFPAGDDRVLAGLLEHLAAHREELAELAASRPRPRSVQGEAADLEDLYRGRAIARGETREGEAPIG